MATAFTLARPKQTVNLARLSDEALAAATRSSPGASDMLYRRHGAALARFCRSILHDPHEAADAAHDAWLRALTALAGGADPSNFKAWLFTIARNRCTDSFRVVRTEDLDGVADTLVDPRVPVDERHHQHAQLDALWSDLRALSKAQCSAFVMSEVLGLTGDELAFSLRRSSESCRALAADARTAVRERQRGRESECSDIRAQLATSRGRSRIIDAHLEVCGDCRLEARRERARRLIRSLAIVPVPVPLFARLRSAQAWLGALVTPGGALPERIGAAFAATAAAAAIGVAAGTGGGGGTGLPIGAVHGRGAVAATHGAPSAPVVARPRRTAAPIVATQPAKQRTAAPGVAAAPSAVGPARRSTAASSTSLARVAPRPNLVQRATDRATHVVAAVQQPARVVAATPAVPAVVEAVGQVATGATSALSGLRPLPNS